jgi:hypothetical protein
VQTVNSFGSDRFQTPNSLTSRSKMGPYSSIKMRTYKGIGPKIVFRLPQEQFPSEMFHVKQMASNSATHPQFQADLRPKFG